MAWNKSVGNLTGLLSPPDNDFDSSNNNSDWSKDVDAVYQMLGPRRDALYVVVPITVMYASIFLTGIIGNVSTCIVIARNKSMHTATNYYLFSLAVSDLLLLVSGLPPEIYLVWSKYPYVFGEGFCVLRGLAAETSTNATVLTITAFTVERYVAICHPFLSHTMSKLSRAIRLILVIWVVALSFAVPQALQFGIVVHPDNASDIVMCTYKTVILEHSFELSTFLFFLVPMTLITVLYALIGLKLRKSNMMKRVSGSGNNDGRKGAAVTLRKDSRNCRHNTGRSSHRVLKMLVAVVVAFFICWAPFHVQRLIAIYGTNTVDHISSNSPWMAFLYLLFTYISGVLYYFSTTVNPILYNIMSNKFREAFMETLSRCCRIGGYKGRRSQRRSYSTLSRSQQRANGVFGCRNGGPHGTQESTDCSGNSQSIRDDSLQQSVSGGGGCNAVSKNPSSDSRPPMSGKRSSSRRTLSTDIGSSEANPIGVKSSGQSQRGRWSQARKSSPRGITGSPESNEGVARVRGTAIVYYRRSGRPRTRRWWDIFKWLSGQKSAAGRGTQYSPPGPLENVVIDVQINPEEYSMTPCNISNTSLRDVDHRAMDEELSAYMEEIRRRELQGEIRASGNG